MRKEIRFSGFGGQGVILMGHIVGQAAVLDENEVSLTQSYGPEARGGACSTDLIVSEQDIYYPQVREMDILVSMSQEALNNYLPDLAEEGDLVIDTGLVECSSREFIGIPATEIAKEELGTRIVSNIVMLGYLVGVTGLVSEGAMKEAIEELVPEGTEEKNIEAFEMGLERAEW